ncbi:MAG: HD domain-containing protein [Candidatus Dojkabacteria bacterium]|nr:HD domain-containing protein [Candidatus Dojkabacteria bacterium]
MMPITRDQSAALLDKHVTTDWIKLHSRETEVIMQALAEKFGEDQDLWGLTGLLHDLDMDKVDVNEPKDHGKITSELLKEEFGDDLPGEMIHAIQAHCENLGYLEVKRESKLDFALAAAENISGFLVACALVMPDKKLASVKPDSVIKKLKKKDFARKVNRDFIYDIDKTGLSLEEFVELALKAVSGIGKEIGL